MFQSGWLRLGKYRITLRKPHCGYFKSWGLALTTNGGCYGSTVGEVGDNMSRSIVVIVGGWSRELTVCWKRLPREINTPKVWG